jgi:signal transduction histidine kinase
MRKLFILYLIFGAATIHAQTLMNRDSLLKLLPAAKEDTNAVLLYINVGQQYENNEPDKAKYYYILARDLSQKINYPRGVIKYIVNYTFVLNMQGLYDSSLILNTQSVQLAREIKDSVYLAKALFNTGSVYRAKGEYENAVSCYEEGKKIFSKFGNANIEAQTDDILQLLYTDLKMYKKAIDYGEKAVAGLQRINDQPSLGMALNNLGVAYTCLKNFDKATLLFKKALDIAYLIGDKNMEQNQYLNLGNIFLEQGEYEKMKPYMDKALLLSKILKAHEIELIGTKGLSYYYTYKKNYILAERFANEALSLSYLFDFKTQRVQVFNQLSKLAFLKQDLNSGNYYAIQSEALSDSLLNETIQKNTMELEKKYETEKKELQIKQLEADKKVQQLSIRQKNTFNYILIGGFASLLLISILSYRTYRQKQALQQQRINELETQQQLTATEAVLKGEEQERTRLAKDLHDGLGGMLSGIKYSFNNMKGNLIMTPENQQAFERSMDMLDSSIKEMRRVAHNMMPEALVKFGLDTALKDFCNDINQTGALNVTYQSIGMEGIMIDQTTAITIYRIVQELINNTMKHAGAKTAIVQVTKSGNQISVTVEDDGKGFNTEILKHARARPDDGVGRGIGYTNIQNRVEFLKGKLDVNSETGKGTSVLIELTV